MLFFGVCFLLYFIKLSAGNGFCLNNYSPTLQLILQTIYCNISNMKNIDLHNQRQVAENCYLFTLQSHQADIRMCLHHLLRLHNKHATSCQQT